MVIRRGFMAVCFIGGLAVQTVSVSQSAVNEAERQQQCMIKKMSFETFVLNFISPRDINNNNSYQEFHANLSYLNALYSKKFQDGKYEEATINSCAFWKLGNCSDIDTITNHEYMTYSNQDWDLVSDCASARLSNNERWDHYNTNPGNNAVTGVGQAIDTMVRLGLKQANKSTRVPDLLDIGSEVVSSQGNDIVVRSEEELTSLYTKFLNEKFENTSIMLIYKGKESELDSDIKYAVEYDLIESCMNKAGQAVDDGAVDQFKDVETGYVNFTTNIEFGFKWENECESVRKKVAKYCNLVDSPCSPNNG